MSKNGIIQLKNLVVFYCKHSGSSRGVRSFLETERLTKFAEEHPSVVVEATERPGRHPFLKGLYLNGFEKTIPLRNMDEKEVERRIAMMRDTAGHVVKRNGPGVFTKHPSIQGVTHMDIGSVPPL
eukprot:EC720678.1.p1 GENE.EC720678.1~~EC720678.1.p1  ORF type:complete len:125 (+),score=16.90 EC720678.1:66-440(+)